MDIDFDTWKKLDLKVAEITGVKDHPNADRLYIIKVKIGNDKKNIIAGIKEFYTKKELIGKKIIVFSNLKPVNLRGIKSEGMLLAAEKEDKVVLLTVDKDISSGSKVS